MLWAGVLGSSSARAGTNDFALSSPSAFLSTVQAGGHPDFETRFALNGNPILESGGQPPPGRTCATWRRPPSGAGWERGRLPGLQHRGLRGTGAFLCRPRGSLLPGRLAGRARQPRPQRPALLSARRVPHPSVQPREAGRRPAHRRSVRRDRPLQSRPPPGPPRSDPGRRPHRRNGQRSRDRRDKRGQRDDLGGPGQS